MGQIRQNADGTYSKSYSDVELAIIRELHAEGKSRIKSDQSLKEEILTLTTRVEGLYESTAGAGELLQKVNANSIDIENHTIAIDELRRNVAVSAYSKTDMDKYMAAWRIEEISAVITKGEELTNALFEEAKMKEIRVGYQHYPNANINDAMITTLESGDKIYSETNMIRPNTVRRYTIWAYAYSNTDADFSIRFGDMCVVYAKGISGEVNQIFANRSFDTARSVKVPLNAGWTVIQFLIANTTQGGGLYVESNLADRASHLASFDTVSGRFSGDQIEEGTIDESHFSGDMELAIRKLHATMALDSAGNVVPSLIAGDGEAGAIQIGDMTLTKMKDEPLILDQDIRIMGRLYDSEGVVIDKDTFNNGLTTEERRKLDSVDYNAEENQNAYSYVEVSGVPYPKDNLGNDIGPDHPQWNPLYNVLTAEEKMETLRIRGDHGIIFDIVKNASGEKELVISAKPTTFKEEKFTASLGQKKFELQTGQYVPGTGTVQVYVGGQRISIDKWDEAGDGKSISFKDGQSAGAEVTVTWTEGAPAYGSETIVTVADIPPATRTSSGLMTKDHVAYLFDHKHKAADIEGLPDAQDITDIKQDIYDLQNQLGGGTGDGSSLSEKVAELEKVVGIGGNTGGGPTLSEKVSDMETALSEATTTIADQAAKITDFETRIAKLEQQIQQALTYS